MGLFSRKPKTPKPIAPGGGAGNDTASLNSEGSNIRSSSAGNSRIHIHNINRTSAGSVPQTPLTPMTPHLMPKVNLPKPPDPSLDAAGYLRSLGSVRERSKVVTDKALRNGLNHFDVDLAKFPDVVTFRDYDPPFSSIPPHGRYQHFCVGGRDRIANLLATFPQNVDSSEKCRSLVDLFLVSVLLDAGAGTSWSFKSAENGRVYRRSEGLAIASLEMFKTGLFSGNPSNKFQVDKDGLRKLTVEQLAKGMQSHPGNEVAGLEGRAQLLIRLGDALESKPEFFGDDGRPGNMIDYLLAHPTTQASSTPIVVLPVLWNVLMSGLGPIWPPSRTAIDGISLGDAWPCSSMPQQAPPTSPGLSPFPNSQAGSGAAAWESILPFHKLTQWLTYSVMQPMQNLLKIHFAGTELLTGLPEYRNGGLFIDLGVLTLKHDDLERGLQNYNDYCRRTSTKGVEVAPMFEPSDDVIVEWRGVTVGFLDKLLVEVNKALKRELNGGELTLAQLLEAGSWKGGREIAEVSRPNTKEPPILIDSDGTVF
ncbi:DUF1688-domain-containing protein [Hypoxylon trugodes]|uniref:DUF1688-domain-containing protein n=1 Tax=Hypoxylon trugodes TaxID=326681 RepID=UPI00218E2723|nr:DUF1688-domain-containing protein [Hypoxylon trugodes]KAI1391730.1 DUF1688-domain-containing protein [Hypoxylon trugodes]